MPAFLIGANVNGRPNFMTAAWSSIVNSEPPMVSVAVRPHRYTYLGIRQNRTFSVNVPSTAQVNETDCCGLFSGAREDKVALCEFTAIYGKLETAPMIRECPLSLECTVVHEIPLGSHSLFIGQIEEVYASEDCLTDGKPDVSKVRPIVYSTGARNAYHALGESVARAFHVGAEWKKSKA
jgi:flavin reductase (DIM6/NTAB) family NADH-FMN oxidoreductase RutF